jgi:tetratricopeptide (TPR) repeat protein
MEAAQDTSWLEKVGKTQKKYEEFLSTCAEVTGMDVASFFRAILQEAYILTDEFLYKVSIQSSSLFLFGKKQGLEKNPDYLRLHDLIRFQPAFEDKLHSILFHQVLHSSFLTQKEADDLLAILRDEEHCRIAACQIVSALFLSIQVCFDMRKLDLLSAAAASKQQEIRARGYTCLLAALSFHKRRIPVWEKEIDELLKRLVESDKGFGAMVLLVTERFTIERKTKEIARCIREEILPRIARAGKEQMETAIEAVNDEEDEVNSEWIVTPSGWLADQLKEMNKLQSEGADMMYISFMGTKKLPFFDDPSHWFLPFIADHAEVQRAITSWGGTPSIACDIEVLPQFCNSDKYSFLLGLHSKADGGYPPLIELLCENTENIEVFRRSQAKISDWGRVQQIVGQYIPDLYRFYHLCPHHSELLDPFAPVPNFYALPSTKSYIHQSVLRHIGNYFFRHKLYSESLAIFRYQADMFLDIFEREGEEGVLRKGDFFGSIEEMKTLVEKTGYCCQKIGNYQEALIYYLWAYVNNGESVRLAKHIAKCHWQIGDFDRAFDYYLACEKASPKDISLLIKMGRCLMLSEKYPEALEYFYKAYFYHSGVRTQRPLAWLLFLLGRYDDAFHYYDNILKEKHPSVEDYINVGHTAFAARRPTSQIMGYYLKALANSKNLEGFIRYLKTDINHLRRVGIRDEEFSLLFDQLKYLWQQRPD